MNIEEQYQLMIQALSQGHRALKRFTSPELEFLERELGQKLESTGPDLEKILCLIEHAATPHPGFEPLIIAGLSKELPDHLMVFLLNCARKHIVQSRLQRGIRLHFEFLEAVKKLLFSPSPEVVEWTLRTIEECGPQGVYFLAEFDKIKPPPWKWFNEHNRAVREIIAMLERRWGKFEKR